MADNQEWAAALWQHYFYIREKPSPVYLSLDDEDLEVIGKNAFNLESADEARRSLLDAVLDQLQIFQTAPLVLGRYVASSRSWYSDSTGKPAEQISGPPQLPFLAVTVLAARSLGSGDDNSLAFYRALRQTLRLREEYEDKLRNAYMHDVEALWKYLNSLLLAIGGTRGIPTATAITHKFVSIPISQSVIRARDQAKLIEFFIDADLSQDSLPSNEELAELFTWWLGRGGHSISANLEGLWHKGGPFRARVLEVISKELEAWDGLPRVSSHHSPGTATAVKLLLRKDQDWFGQTSISIGLGFLARADKNVQVVEVKLASEGEEPQLAQRVGHSDYFELPSTNSHSAEELLVADSEYSLGEEVAPIKKQARSLYVLSFNPDAQCFLEINRPKIGETLVLIAAEVHGVAGEVEKVIQSHAAPGAQELAPSAHGLVGWRVFQNVRLTRPFSDKRLLEGLSTASHTQFTITDGMRLRDGIGGFCWSRHLPPRISATSPEGGVLRVELVRHTNSGDELVGHSTGFGSVALESSQFHLIDGDYSALLFIGQERQPKATKSLKIRSESSPRFPLHDDAMVVGYAPNSITPDLGELPNVWVGFPSTPSTAHLKPPVVSIPEAPFWLEGEEAKVESTRQPSSLVAADSASCTFTGAHRWELGNCQGQQRYVDAFCTLCGNYRRELCVAWLADKERRGKMQEPAVETQAIEKIEIEYSEKTLDANRTNAWALHRSLFFMRRGTYTEIREIAASLEIDHFETRRLIRWLEARGSIEIQNHFADDAQWSVNPSMLVEQTDGSLRIEGWFSDKLLIELREIIGTENVEHLRGRDLGESIILRPQSESDLKRLIESIEARVVEKSADSIAGVLQPVDRLLLNRQLEFLPHGARLEKFSVSTARWQKVDDGQIRGFGAYRMTGSFSTGVYFVPLDGVDARKGFRLDSISAKYLAAHVEGRPLVAYAETKQRLYVPFGMELPGLFGRLASQGTGMPPKVTKRKTSAGSGAVLSYDNVSPIFAHHIFKALGGT